MDISNATNSARNWRILMNMSPRTLSITIWHRNSKHIKGRRPRLATLQEKNRQAFAVSGVTTCRHRELGGHSGGHVICRGGTGSSSLYVFQYHNFQIGGTWRGTWPIWGHVPPRAPSSYATAYWNAAIYLCILLRLWQIVCCGREVKEQNCIMSHLLETWSNVPILKQMRNVCL